MRTRIEEAQNALEEFQTRSQLAKHTGTVQTDENGDVYIELSDKAVQSKGDAFNFKDSSGEKIPVHVLDFSFHA